MDRKDIRPYIKSQQSIIVKVAEDGFNSGGRGAVLVDLSGPPNAEFVYITSEQLNRIGKVDDKEIYRKLATYDPVREIVVVIILKDGLTHTIMRAYPLAK